MLSKKLTQTLTGIIFHKKDYEMKTNSFTIARIVLCILTIYFLLSCSSEDPDYNLSANGSYGLSKMPKKTYTAIKSACDDKIRGATSVGLSKGECYLIMSGSTVRESSWQPDKACEAWGQPDNPACGLTQSRKTDADALELGCDPTQKNKAGYKCNVLTGLNNMRCEASAGKDCAPWGDNASLEVGIKKHLGKPNQHNFPSYKDDMKTAYEREDIRKQFEIDKENIRTWDDVLVAGRDDVGSWRNQGGNVGQKAMGRAVQNAPKLKQRRVGCVDPDGDGWGWDGSKSCEISRKGGGNYQYSSGKCVDPDGDGWGWDGSKSCKM